MLEPLLRSLLNLHCRFQGCLRDRNPATHGGQAVKGGLNFENDLEVARVESQVGRQQSLPGGAHGRGPPSEIE